VLMKFPAFHGSHVYVTSLLVHSLSHWIFYTPPHFFA
jgi:hypothetical protein